MFSDADIARLADDGCPWADDYDGDDQNQEVYDDLQGDDLDGVSILRMIDDGCPHNPEDEE